MLQCNRCRMQLPDGTQTCSRCGGTVLTPIQPQPQQRARPQGHTVNGNRPNGNRQQVGQRPQRPQRPQSQMTNGHSNQLNQNQQIGEEFLEGGFDDFNSGAGQQFNQPINQQNQQGIQPGNKNNTNKKPKILQTSRDGSSVIDWLIMMVCLLIPCLNIWYIFKTLSKNSIAPDYKKNYIKAFLIYFVVMSILSFIITAVFGNSIAYWLASAL